MVTVYPLRQVPSGFGSSLSSWVTSRGPVIARRVVEAVELAGAVGDALQPAASRAERARTRRVERVIEDSWSEEANDYRHGGCGTVTRCDVPLHNE